MTDARQAPSSRALIERSLKRRNAAERRFRLYGVLAICVALGFLALLLGRIIQQGHSAFVAHEMSVSVPLDPSRIDRSYPAGANYDLMAAEQVGALLGISPTDEAALTEVREILSPDVGLQLGEQVRDDPALIGQTITIHAPLGDDADQYLKGEINRETLEAQRVLTDRQLDWIDRLEARGVISSALNTGLFTRGDSTQAELAGLLGAIVGSALMLLVTAAVALPIGLLAAVWLEEFAPKGRLTDFIEVNINNLAAVPSIVYGLLGLAVFINTLGLPRASPLVGGLVLALMALPTVIIATRSSLRAVPPSIREAALALGASKTQAVFGHVVPLAMPGVMTGAIIALAHALGETAPLLMIGMISFVPGVAEGFTSAASTLPTQIFIWENAAERAFHERTAAAIIVLLAFMILMNAAAIFLRRRFERRW
ncbi:phosphate ABC transporter permease PstA [Brevundimonas sp. 2R-24]|uniref:Phosphate transport system permease protein PstA n=1 Tax=Peiella sedimenti TaxID=3061083 RepID=A0ABT8SLB0_9CAUL|nr:phosphate ABC transporter permease PstA [Caulobacteraceae bacterium XZ-24]